MEEEPYNITSVHFADLLGITRQAVQQNLLRYQKSQSKNRKPITISPDIARSLLLERGHVYKNMSVAFQLLKGGVGKTSIAANFGIRAAAYGHKVLFVDLDHQSNLSSLLRVRAKNSLIDWIDDKIPNIKDLIIPVSKNIDIIPSTIRDADFSDRIREKNKDISSLLANPFSELKKEYDLIICDCPPAIGLHVAAVYLAVDIVYAPIVPDKFSEEALQEMFQIWNRLIEVNSKNKNRVIKLILNKHDSRVKASIEKSLSLIKQYSDILCPVFIRYSSDFLTAQNQNKCLWEISKKSSDTASSDVDAIVRYELGLSDLEKRQRKISTKSSNENNLEV